MNKKWVTIVALIIMVAGIVCCYLTGSDLAGTISLSLTMFAAGVAAFSFVENRDKSKPKWLSIVGCLLLAVGAFVLGYFQFDKDTFTTYITLVFGLVVIIAGVIVNAVVVKK